MIFKKDKSIYTKLANKYNLSYQVVEVICNHPFRFANRVIADDNDERVLMFGYLFKIKLKKKYEGRKANKQENKDNSISESVSDESLRELDDGSK
ncbi:MAG: hypothetical protein J6A25_05810 [Lachnospiraceae bacterium]|nr:hypothetical protein [Lachnospiraceae bacterium]